MQINFLKKLIIILNKEQLYARVGINQKRFMTFFKVKKSVLFVDKLKAIKNIIRFFLLFIFYLRS